MMLRGITTRHAVRQLCRCYSSDANLARLIAFHQREHNAVEAADEARRELRWIGEAAAAARGVGGSEAITKMSARRAAGEPLAYVLGNQPFGPLLIACQAPVLIPRIETEYLAENVADRLLDGFAHSAPLRILDLCTGTGCIALYLQHRLQNAGIAAQITAVDASPQAVALAMRNANACKTSSQVEARFEVLHRDLFDDEAMQAVIDTRGPFDLVTCNPPYIPQNEWPRLESGIREWEDPAALIGGDSGLVFYERLADLLAQHANRFASRLAMEVGHDQADAVKTLFQHRQQALPHVEIWTDPFGIKRGVFLGKT